MARSKRPTERSIPDTMNAAAIDRFGPPSMLKLHRLPVPHPGPTEVLIAIDTAGVGGWDASIRDGSWRPPGRQKFPLIPGTDGAGTVVARGSRVTRLRIGDRVYAYEFGNPHGGFYAEFAVAQADRTGRVPTSLNLRAAGAVATTGLTALQGIRALQLRRGQTVLIFGASGAVGTIAVQFAAQRGARVIGTASSRAAERLVRRLGATDVVDAREKRGVAHLRDIAAEGLDAVFALASGKDLDACLDLVRRGGRLVYPNGIEPEPRRRSAVRLHRYDAVASPQEFALLTRAIAKAHVRVPIAATYPLAHAARAHQRLTRGGILGRLALRIGR
jgi:NADPH2:quinone reductase